MPINPQMEEANGVDFERLTTQIMEALSTIRAKRSIPATQEKLAELAGCSRKTLHNRSWPITELKKVKEARKDKGAARDGSPHEPGETGGTAGPDREELLTRDVENLMEENGKLFARNTELEEQYEQASELVRRLQEEVEALKEVNRQLKKELRASDRSHHPRANVIKFTPGGPAPD
jgi:hypothetical protein